MCLLTIDTLQNEMCTLLQSVFPDSDINHFRKELKHLPAVYSKSWKYQYQRILELAKRAIFTNQHIRSGSLTDSQRDSIPEAVRCINDRLIIFCQDEA